MSAYRLTYLYCDGEGCVREDGQVPFQVDPLPDETAADHRAAAKGFGWIRRKGKDYCSSCAEKVNDR